MKVLEEPFGCGGCKKAFTTTNYLAQHVELHHARKKPQNKLNYDYKITKIKPTYNKNSYHNSFCNCS
jgi:hypothetical protein